MKHPIFGELYFDHLWKKDYSLKLYGQTCLGKLEIYGDIDEEIEDMQIKAYESFEENISELPKLIEDALFRYYNDVVEEYRDMYGESADSHAPRINSSNDMKNLVSFEALYIPYSFSESELVVGVMFTATWEIDNGVAVKIVNGKISEVGYQDIVL